MKKKPEYPERPRKPGQSGQPQMSGQPQLSGQPPLPEEKKPGFFTKHAGLRYFLITFGVCLVIGGIITAYMLLSLRADVTPTRSTSVPSVAISIPDQSSSKPSVAVADSDSFNLLLVTYDDSPVTVQNASSAQTTPGLPATIALVRLDQANTRVAVLPIPLELQATSDGVTDTVGDFYAKNGISGLTAAVCAKLHAGVNYTCAVPFSGLSKIISAVGGISYKVPYDASYTTNDQRPLTVKAGTQYLNADTMEAMLGSASYGGGSLQKCDVVADFLKSFLQTKLTGTYIDNAQTIYTNVLAAAQSTLHASDLAGRADTLRTVTTKSADFVRIIKPQYTPIVQGQTSVFDYNAESASLFTIYFKAKSAS